MDPFFLLLWVMRLAFLGLLYLVGTVPEASGIDDVQGHAVDLNMLPEHIPGRAGDGGDDGGILTAERVEQAGFSGVGATGDDEFHAVSHYAPLAGLG